MAIHSRIYTTIAAGLTLGFSLACTSTGLEDSDTEVTGSDSDSDVSSDGCPDDMLPVDVAEVSLLGFEVNYLNYNATFDVDAEYDGVPSACISSDGHKLRLMVEVDEGEAFATFVFEADAAEEYDPLEEQTAASFRITVSGVEDGPFTWQDGDADISAGSWVVEDLGEDHIVSLNITAADSAEATMLSLQLEAAAELP